MWEWFNTGAGAISVVGVWVTFLSWLSGRQTKKILARQAEILADQGKMLAHMEANALTRHGAVMEKLEGRA
jgi:hypothetical protein